jgi:hypothetical protein
VLDVGARGAAARLRRLFDARDNPRWRRWLPETLVLLLYLGLAFVVTAGLWLSGGSAATADNTRDHAQFLFFFEHAAHAVVDLHNPFFTPLLAAPYGVNLMANTAFLGLAVPLIPVTLTLGPGVSYALALTIGLAGTATAWYYVLRRHVTGNRVVAAVIGAFCGFFPGIVGHGNGHPNISAQFMLPLIVSAVIRLRSTPHPVRTGVVLGLMAAYQVFLNEELLLFTVAACVVMVLTYAASRPAEARAAARHFLLGLAVAVGVAGVLTAYPLWFQFFGPQHYRGPFGWAQFYGADLAIYAAYGTNSIAGRLGAASPLNDDPGETNAFIGLPLVLFAVVIAAVLWRVLAVRIAAVVAAVFALLSLGDTIIVNGRETGVAGPWRVLSYLPLLDSVITIRLALVVVPAIGVIVAAGLDRLLSDLRGVPRALVWGLAAAVLLPLVPTPLRVTQPDELPAFITAGTWREYLDDGTLVPIPPDPYSEPTLRALVTTDLQTRFVDGYFLGPTSPENPIARYGPPDRPTGLLLTEIAVTGLAPEVDDELRATAREDIRFWEADALILAPQEHFEVLRTTVSALIDREGEPRDGVWVWDVRDLR